MAKNVEIPDLENIMRGLLSDLETFAGTTAVNFFKNSFHNQGWTDESFTAWQPRKSGADGRAILTNTTNLRESLRVLDSSPLRIIFGTSEPYAQIHNEGGTIQVRVTPKSRKYFWYMYRMTENQMWKGMALTKKEYLTIRMPKRQFIGESRELINTLQEWFQKEAEKRLPK